MSWDGPVARRRAPIALLKTAGLLLPCFHRNDCLFVSIGYTANGQPSVLRGGCYQHANIYLHSQGNYTVIEAIMPFKKTIAQLEPVPEVWKNKTALPEWTKKSLEHWSGGTACCSFRICRVTITETQRSPYCLTIAVKCRVKSCNRHTSIGVEELTAARERPMRNVEKVVLA
jgi:hypothetical protein